MSDCGDCGTALLYLLSDWQVYIRSSCRTKSKYANKNPPQKSQLSTPDRAVTFDCDLFRGWAAFRRAGLSTDTDLLIPPPGSSGIRPTRQEHAQCVVGKAAVGVTCAVGANIRQGSVIWNASPSRTGYSDVAPNVLVWQGHIQCLWQ